MDTHSRLAIEAVVAALRKSGAINDRVVGEIAVEIRRAAEQMDGFGRDGVAQMRALADHVQDGRISRTFPD